MSTRPIVRLDLDSIVTVEKDCDEEYYIWMLEVQFFCIEYNWVQANPIVKVQRLWRKYRQLKL
jgi:hypothetical protein